MANKQEEIYQNYLKSCQEPQITYTREDNHQELLKNAIKIPRLSGKVTVNNAENDAVYQLQDGRIAELKCQHGWIYFLVIFENQTDYDNYSERSKPMPRDVYFNA